MKRLLLLLWLAAAPLMLAGQDYQAPEVKVSTEKVKIGEKLFLVHKVLPKQTVFSICKAYDITAEELNAANPDLKDGLKAGSLLYIPLAADAVEKVPAQQEKTEEKEEKAETDGAHQQDGAPSRVIEYKVRLFDSARSIARKFDITPEELLDYNGISGRNLTVGTILLIPVREADPSEEEAQVKDHQEDGQNLGEAEEQPEDPMSPVRKARWFSAGDPLRIALVLPFNATETPSTQFLNFYSGALMAVQDQKEQGAHVVLNVYDLARGAEEILNDSKFAGCDLIIGPVEAKTMDPFLAFSDENGVAFVSPLDHKADSLADTHPFFFQVPPSQLVQATHLVSDLHAGLHQRVLLVQGPASDSVFLRQVETALRRNDVTYRKVTAGELPNLVSTYASPLIPAKVIIGTENKAVATEVISSLNTLAKKNTPMEVYCSNRVRNYETSDPDALFNISAHIPAPYFVDYSDPKDQQFVLQYRALFSTEPDDFAFQGYDVLSYFIAAMTRLGTGFIDNADAIPMQLLHCNFHFRRDNEKSGWRNHATRNLLYEKDDFSIAIEK